uniref:RING-type E3 ubiquitin transferase n=1 Tax=Strix occidentalis caurina TaxID=311401 RepID=A0A8D0FX89_STROC
PWEQRGYTSEEDRCPICLNTWDNTAYTMTCLHRFCFDCLWWWAEFKIECPVCRRTVTRSRQLLQGYQFEEFPRTQPSVASLGSTLSWGVSQERQERCLSTVQSWPEYREKWHRNYMALTTSAGLQERGELSPVASTSAVPSRGGTPEPGPAPSATLRQTGCPLSVSKAAILQPVPLLTAESAGGEHPADGSAFLFLPCCLTKEKILPW